MWQCPNPNCGRTVHSDWWHCAFCGAYVQGGPRVGEDECDHEFVIEGPYCVRCGFDPAVGGTSERRWMFVLAIACIAVGLALATYSAMVLGRPANPTDDPSVGRSASRVFSYVVVAGFALFGYGLARLLKAMRIGP